MTNEPFSINLRNLKECEHFEPQSRALLRGGHDRRELKLLARSTRNFEKSIERRYSEHIHCFKEATHATTDVSKRKV